MRRSHIHTTILILTLTLTLALIVGGIFGSDYCFRFYLAKDKLAYFFEPMPMIDFVTVPNPIS